MHQRGQRPPYTRLAATLTLPTNTDVGKWRLSETGYCVTWDKIRSGQEACFTVVRDGTSIRVLNSDQSPSAEVLRIVG